MLRGGAERNKVRFRIIAGLAAKLLVVNLKVGHRAAGLTSPAVATQHLAAEIVILLEPQAGTFRSASSHVTFSVTWCKNVCLSSPDRNLKNSKADSKSASEFSFPRFAPAKKSAQITSRK